MNQSKSASTAIDLSLTDFDLPPGLTPDLAKYSSFTEIARGGTGRLQACWDRVVGRSVVIKTLLPQFQLTSSENVRLLREGRVTAMLQHPNTVPVYEIGKDPQQGLFFAMKRISGENFFEVLKRVARKEEDTLSAFPPSRRLDIAIDAAQALDYAHARGVIHRDVKPENIWVGNFGEVILLDWGVAKVWGQPDAPERTAEQLAETDAATSDHTQHLTMAGQRPGTPLYMAPEQVDCRHVDERSDIFSLGVVLYELLTLSEPFRGRVVSETFENIRHKMPPPPSTKADFDLPQELDDVVLRSIQKRPEQRYQTVRELIVDLQDLLPRLS